MAIVSKFSSARGADARTGDSQSPGRRIDSTVANILFFTL